MIIDWAHFLFALVLLWLPRPVLRLGGRLPKVRRRRSASASSFEQDPLRIREPGDASVSFRTEFSKARNYVDLLRAALGGVMLLGITPAIDPAIRPSAGATTDAAQLVFYGQLLVLVIAVMIQSFRFDSRVTLFAPIFFISGLSVGLCGPYAAGFALVLIWTLNLALPNPSGFLSVYAILILLFGLLFLGITSPLPLFSAILFFMPVLVSLLIRRPLVLFARKVKTGGSAAAT